jgi:tRNA(fMet)-specific endonuclease VapC
MRYVLDTNTVAAVLNGNPTVVDRFNSVLPDNLLFIPAVALAELQYGALSSQRIAENLARIDRILRILIFAPVDRPIAERFGLIKARLRRQGVSKSDADLFVASTALEMRATLITDDGGIRDAPLGELKVENWLR